MPTATYESSASDAVILDIDTDITITKPTGLTAGDLLLFVGGIADARTFTLPSGWTSQSNVSDGTFRIEVFSKIADSGDAAATNVTFNTSATFSNAIGFLFRISTAVDTGMVFSYATGPNDQTQQCADITTAADNSLVVWGCYKGGGTSTGTINRGTERVDAAPAADFIYGATEAIVTAGAQTGAVITTSAFGAKRLFSIAVSPTGGGGGTAVPVFTNLYRQRGA